MIPLITANDQHVGHVPELLPHLQFLEKKFANTHTRSSVFQVEWPRFVSACDIIKASEFYQTETGDKVHNWIINGRTPWLNANEYWTALIGIGQTYQNNPEFTPIVASSEDVWDVFKIYASTLHTLENTFGAPEVCNYHAAFSYSSTLPPSFPDQTILEQLDWEMMVRAENEQLFAKYGRLHLQQIDSDILKKLELTYNDHPLVLRCHTSVSPLIRAEMKYNTCLNDYFYGRGPFFVLEYRTTTSHPTDPDTLLFYLVLDMHYQLLTKGTSKPYNRRSNFAHQAMLDLVGSVGGKVGSMKERRTSIALDKLNFYG